MKEVILLYNIRDEKSRGFLSSICDAHQIELKHVSPEESSVPLGFLAYGTDEQKAPYMADDRSGQDIDHPDQTQKERFPGEPMIIFAGFTNPRLTMMLDLLKVNKLASPSLKAVLTEFNAVWDSMTLYEQLTEERARFI